MLIFGCFVLCPTEKRMALKMTKRNLRLPDIGARKSTLPSTGNDQQPETSNTSHHGKATSGPATDIQKVRHVRKKVPTVHFLCHIYPFFFNFVTPWSSK